MKLSNHLKSLWLSLQYISLAGLRRERAMSHSVRTTAQRWLVLAKRDPTDEELERLVHRLRLFEKVHNRRPNEQETDAIIQQLLQFPTGH